VIKNRGKESAVMKRSPKAVYTLEYKLEAVRLVKNGQSMAAVAKVLGIAEQTLYNWIKLDREGKLGGPGAKPVNPEQMEIARLRAENARLKMERDILGNRPRALPRPMGIETSSPYTATAPGQRPLAFWRR
jgi:transposase